jgi:hypothetical protein
MLYLECTWDGMLVARTYPGSAFSKPYDGCSQETESGKSEVESDH